MRKRGSSAFTLIELLVVVAIVALLASLLLPSLGRAKALAREMKCKSNLHAIGSAVEMYAAANNGYVPRDFWYGCNVPNTTNTGHYLFAAKLAQYLGGQKVPFQYDDNDTYLAKVFEEMPIYRCPSVVSQQYLLTYVINGVDFEYYQKYRGYSSGAASSLAKLPGPASEIAYLVEADLNWLPPRQFGYYDVYAPWGMTFSYGVPNTTPRAIRYSDQRHLGRTTVVFFDGHCETRDLHPDDLPVRLFNPLDHSGP